MVVQLLFSVTFALSCTMFELIIFEIVGILGSRYGTEYMYNVMYETGKCTLQ